MRGEEDDNEMATRTSMDQEGKRPEIDRMRMRMGWTRLGGLCLVG